MAKQTFELTADFREDQGKGASRRLRREGKIPAVLYGGGQEPRALSLDHDQFMHQLDNEAFYSSILTIKVGDTEQPVFLKDLQRHPAKRLILHADFQRIVAGEKINITVPLHFMGEKDAPGVRDGGIVSHQQTDVEIVCLPKDLPEYIEVDVSGVELEGMLLLSELTAPEGVEFADLMQGRENDQPVVSIHRPARIEEETEEGEEEPGEVPTVGDEKAEEEQADDDESKD